MPFNETRTRLEVFTSKHPRKGVSFKTHLPKSSKDRVLSMLLTIMDKFSRQAIVDILWSIERTIESELTRTERKYGRKPTGSLAASFVPDLVRRIIATRRSIILRRLIKSDHPAAAILQTGGRIYPRQSSRLVVPISQHIGTDISWEEAWTLLRARKLYLKKGKLYYYSPYGLIPLFVLKTMVKMPRLNYITKALRRAGFRPRSRARSAIEGFLKDLGL